MEVLRDGTFSFDIGPEELARGLRPSKRSPRNVKFLVQCIGAVGIDNVLQVIDDLETSRIDTTALITDAFPYPQIFVFTNMILICDIQNIYSWDGANLNLELGPVAAGGLWQAIDLYEFVYMTNGVVVVIRDPTTGVFSITTDYPASYAACNFNGQVILGGLVD